MAGLVALPALYLSVPVLDGRIYHYRHAQSSGLSRPLPRSRMRGRSLFSPTSSASTSTCLTALPVLPLVLLTLEA